MGMFLSMSGVVGATSADVLAALKTFAEQASQVCDLAEGRPGESGIGVISGGGGSCTVIYPEDFLDWDQASEHLSATLSKPVFSFHIHDGDLWMYILFHEGQPVDHFNPVPAYWEENLPQEDLDLWKGNAKLVSQLVPSAAAEAIAKYLITWDLEAETTPKAYPEDEFPVCDCWQVSDFMKKLGLDYPIADDGSVLGETFYLGKKKRERATDTPVPPPSSQDANPSKKPWWKFW
jgi:hypothetical protein